MHSAANTDYWQSFERLGAQLESAGAERDWQALGELDGQLRELIFQLETLGPEASENRDLRVLKARQKVRAQYAKLLPELQQACENVRVLLLKHLEQSEARSAYARSYLLEAGR